jgi:hypothetical protein
MIRLAVQRANGRLGDVVGIVPLPDVHLEDADGNIADIPPDLRVLKVEIRGGSSLVVPVPA